MSNKGMIPISVYLGIALLVVIALSSVTIWGQHQKILRLEDKVAVQEATIKNKTETAKTQRDSDAKVIEAKDAIIKDLLDNQPVCPPTVINCPDGKCNVTIEPCEAPF